MATYHGITKATCLSCGLVTTDEIDLVTLNDLDSMCRKCGESFVKWESESGNSITIDVKDYQGNSYFFREDIKEA